jgi:uncharacterized glyoxalase superfamily protein PhnB
MPEYEPGVIPMIAYRDGIAALEWLARAFGFQERRRMQSPDGTLTHGEMAAGSGMIILATPTPDYEGPEMHREHCEPARRWSNVPWIIDGVLVYVEDVDSHFEQARSAGARILSEPAEGPVGRSYRAEDLEGHRWMFMGRTT